jgi:hypothetical protein
MNPAAPQPTGPAQKIRAGRRVGSENTRRLTARINSLHRHR